MAASRYRLDPAIQAFVDATAGFAPADSSLAARRTAFRSACRAFTPTPPPNLVIQDQELHGLRLRLYQPQGTPPASGWPTVLYLHGGGWDLGDLDTHDWFVYRLAQRGPFAVLAVAYRLAPEHPFPAPLEDALAVWRALAGGHWPTLDAQRLAVVGDSAGGCLAAGLCLALRQSGEPQPRLQGLVYPVLSDREDLPSMLEHADAPMLTRAGLALSLSAYVPTAQLRRDPRALPLAAADLQGLAPAFIGIVELDPLRDQGRAYRDRLLTAGVPVTLHQGHGLPHASLRALGVAEVELFYDALGAALVDALAISSETSSSHHMDTRT